MRIDLSIEKQKALSTQEMYEILDFATQAAEDNGFINSFIFKRALYLFAAIRLFEERKEEIAHLVAENINTAWDTLVSDGTMDEMLNNYAVDLNLLAEDGDIWLSEFTEYAHSARGLLSTIQDFTGDIVKQATQQLQNLNNDPAISNIVQLGENFGIDNRPIELTEEERESLFSQ